MNSSIKNISSKRNHISKIGIGLNDSDPLGNSDIIQKEITK
jgi:hypothetical protein